ncbi:MAG: signal peptide peptidase SppA [Dysgonamonadaceae bacterium]|jgi:protease-4|nr:signal peptide peptidase SppA [Dysgonamonadaceae bacterium]
MKDFLKIMLASAVGFIVANIIFSIVSLIFFFGMLSSMISGFDKNTFVLKNNSVLHLRLEGLIQERVNEDAPFLMLVGNGQIQNLGLNDVVSAIRKAKTNDKIKGIYIESKMFSASSATLEAIRNELNDFKESGKFIVAYADNYLQDGYYVASVADRLAVNPIGSLDLHGLTSMPLFYKDALSKLGVEVQVFKVGSFKSAVEPFIDEKMSDANREQTTSLLNDIWGKLKEDIASGRNLSAADIDSAANQMPLLKDPDFLIANHLADTLLYETEMKAYLRQLLNVSEEEEIASATVEDMKSVRPAAKKKSKKRIALLYADGEIYSGSGSYGIQDRFFVSQIEALRKDDDVKAVVFRVNSPGGSAYASEQIWKALSDLKAQKPVVVSMGDMAASGGYYISCNANRIVAEPTSITGSIGIFGLIPNLQGTAKKLGIATDVVKTNDFGDFGDLSRPMRKEEKDLLQKNVEQGYDLFVTRCAEGRNMPKDSILHYAEGRVWSGSQAKKIGLVDELGGIHDAIVIAAELADLADDYAVYEYPKMRSFIEELLDPQKEKLALKALKEYVGEDFATLMQIKKLKNQDFVQARLPFEFNIK